MSKIHVIHVSDLHCSKKSKKLSFYNPDSDVHLLKQLFKSILSDKTTYLQTSYDPLQLYKAIKFIKNNIKDINIFIASGDLATTGRTKNLTIAFDLFHSEIESISVAGNYLRPLSFKDFELPYLVIPGNHDRFKYDLGKFENENYDDVFDKEQHFSNYKYWEKGKKLHYNIVQNHEQEKMAFIGVDFSIRKCSDAAKIDNIGKGEIDLNLLTKLEQKTKHAQDKNIAVAWVVHFPPEFGGDKKLEFIGGRYLIELAEEIGVYHILCGHQHQYATYKIGKVNIITAGSISSFESRSEFNEICFDINEGEILDFKVTSYYEDSSNYETVGNFYSESKTAKEILAK